MQSARTAFLLQWHNFECESKACVAALISQLTFYTENQKDNLFFFITIFWLILKKIIMGFMFGYVMGFIYTKQL